jgi:dTDP-4-dehydrorhamnose reductase
MKILITGGKGQLGADCAQALCGSHDIVAIDLDELDITDMSDVERVVQESCPEIILNCAAYTQVDACETDRELAWHVNVNGPKNLALSARNCHAQMIHISTDYVFDGTRQTPQPYREDDNPAPISYYGKTKLEGEMAVKETTPNHMIIRTAWLYGVNGDNILKTFLRLALKTPEKEIKVVNDQFGSPTWSHRLALQIAKLIETNGQGVYHATSEGYCTWYDLAQYFLQKMEVPHRVVPCTTAEYPTPATRPKNAILENHHLKEQGINLMPFWEEDVTRFVGQHRAALVTEIERQVTS